MDVRNDPNSRKLQNCGFCPVSLATTSDYSPQWVAQHTTTQNFGSSRELTQIFIQNPIFDPLCPKFVPKTCLLDYMLLEAIKNMKSKHQFTSKSSPSSFSPKTHNFPFSSKTHKQPHQFKPHQHTNTIKYLWSEFEHVSTIIIHQFMLHTWISKNHQNNLSTTTTMNFKHITHQFHELYHTHNFTWIKNTKFFIKIHKKLQFTIYTYSKNWRDEVRA